MFLGCLAISSHQHDHTDVGGEEANHHGKLDLWNNLYWTGLSDFFPSNFDERYEIKSQQPQSSPGWIWAAWLHRHGFPASANQSVTKNIVQNYINWWIKVKTKKRNTSIGGRVEASTVHLTRSWYLNPSPQIHLKEKRKIKQNSIPSSYPTQQSSC